MLHSALPGRMPTDDARLATALAVGAGAVLIALRAEVDAGTLSGGALEGAGDAAAQTYLAAMLARARPADVVLSEEAPDDTRRLHAERVWIVDPLDGSREFAERTAEGHWRDDFCVHVALWQRPIGLTAGAVALPGRGLVYGSGAPPRPDPAAAEAVLAGRRPLRVAVSRSRPPAALDRLGADVELVALGSSGAKAMAVLEGIVDAYVHAGGQHEWDSAAPVAVAVAAGFVATRLDGSPLVYNKPDPSSPDVLICHPALAGTVTALLESVGYAAAGGTGR